MPDKTWDQYRKELQAGDNDWVGAAGNEEYGRYLWEARQRFQKGQAATVQQVKALYRRVARQLRDEIKDITPGTLRHAHTAALAKALDKAADTLNRDTLDTITQGIRLAVDEAVRGPQQISLDLLQGVFDAAQVKWLFADINQRAVLSLLARTRHKDKLKLSDRVWRTSQHARQALQKIVEDGVTRGLDARRLARQVQQYLEPDTWTALKSDTRQRLRVPRNVSMEAMRLAVTETNNAFHEGTINAYQAVPSARGVYWRLSKSHPVYDICDQYAAHNGNGFWEKGTEPAKPHPWCLCVLLPAMEDPDTFREKLRAWVQNPASQPDIETWYNTTARRFLTRPSGLTALATGADSEARLLADGPLGRHGFSRKVARALERLAEDLRKRTVVSGTEYAGMIDADTGVKVGPILKGGATSVNLQPHINVMVPGRRYVHIHTHPGSSSFSHQDVAQLYYHQGPARDFRSIFVIGEDGTAYVMSRKVGAQLADPTAIEAAYIQERDRLRPKWEAEYRSGRMTAAAAWKEHTHEIWMNIADQLGLLYDRLGLKP